MKFFLLSFFITNCFFVYSQQAIEPFLPEITKQFPNVRDIAISPNGNEIMFSAQSAMGNVSAIIILKKEGETWGVPNIASFSGKYFDIEPVFSKDGLKLYFASSRALNESVSEAKDFDIWYVERKTLNDNWSKPINLGFPINTEDGEFYPSIANNGNLYFTRDSSILKGKDDIYMSTSINGKYSDVKVLPNTINSEGYEFNAFISPDESFIIYTCYERLDGFGSGDLYISYNLENNWTAAKNLGIIINSNKMDYCPFLDTKTNTLYFTSKVDHTITTFEKPLSIDDLYNEFNKYDNGLSRLYKVSIEDLLKK